MTKKAKVLSIAVISFALVSSAILVLSHLGSIKSFEPPPNDAWYRDISATEELVGWKKIPKSEFSPVKDSVDAKAEGLLATRTFTALSQSEARSMASSKIQFKPGQRSYLVRGVFTTRWADDPAQSFTVYTSKTRILLSQGAWGRYDKMGRKALVVLVSFTPTETYCASGSTI